MVITKLLFSGPAGEIWHWRCRHCQGSAGNRQGVKEQRR